MRGALALSTNWTVGSFFVECASRRASALAHTFHLSPFSLYLKDLAEAKNAEVFTEQIKTTPLQDVVFAPRVVNDLTTRSVLVTEWVDGQRLDESTAQDVTILCSIAMNTYLTMLLELGLLRELCSVDFVCCWGYDTCSALTPHLFVSWSSVARSDCDPHPVRETLKISPKP